MGNKIPFTKRLKEAREKKGLSQKALGIAAGIDPSSASVRMNQYEKGVHNPDLSIVEKLADVLEVPTAYLFTVEDDLAQLILEFKQLKPAERKQVLNDIGQQEK